MQDDKHTVNLDRFFAEAKGEPPEMPMHLMEAILGDAADISALHRQTEPEAPRPRQQRGWLRALIVQIGGFPSLAALAASALIGISAGYSGTYSLESLPGMGTFVSGISDDPLNDLGFGYNDTFNDFLAEG